MLVRYISPRPLRLWWLRRFGSRADVEKMAFMDGDRVIEAGNVQGHATVFPYPRDLAANARHFAFDRLFHGTYLALSRTEAR